MDASLAVELNLIEIVYQGEGMKDRAGRPCRHLDGDDTGPNPRTGMEATPSHTSLHLRCIIWGHKYSNYCAEIQPDVCMDVGDILCASLLPASFTQVCCRPPKRSI